MSESDPQSWSDLEWTEDTIPTTGHFLAVARALEERLIACGRNRYGWALFYSPWSLYEWCPLFQTKDSSFISYVFGCFFDGFARLLDDEFFVKVNLDKELSYSDSSDKEEELIIPITLDDFLRDEQYFTNCNSFPGAVVDEESLKLLMKKLIAAKNCLNELLYIFPGGHYNERFNDVDNVAWRIHTESPKWEYDDRNMTQYTVPNEFYEGLSSYISNCTVTPEKANKDEPFVPGKTYFLKQWEIRARTHERRGTPENNPYHGVELSWSAEVRIPCSARYAVTNHASVPADVLIYVRRAGMVNAGEIEEAIQLGGDHYYEIHHDFGLGLNMGWNRRSNIAPGESCVIVGSGGAHPSINSSPLGTILKEGNTAELTPYRFHLRDISTTTVFERIPGGGEGWGDLGKMRVHIAEVSIQGFDPILDYSKTFKFRP